MRSHIARSFLISVGFLTCLIGVFPATTVLAINKETQFVPDGVYDYLFYEGFSIIRANIIGKVVMGPNGYKCHPRLRPTSRPRSVEYTTFSFDGYWERRPWERKDPAGRYWDKRHKRELEKDTVPGTWFFKVRWTTRTKWTVQKDLLTIVEFKEVMPDAYFIKHGASYERHDFVIEKPFPDKEHEIRAYVHGVFGIYRQMK